MALHHDMIAIGASAGGVETLSTLVAQLPADLPATLFVVQHTAPDSPWHLPGILAQAGRMLVERPIDRSPIARSTIYLAPPDRHLLVERDLLRVVRGPKENRHRPAIDPLFRSLAWSYGPRAVGVVLSGSLDDGAAGLWAVKSCGGVTIVQDPADAVVADMPANALNVLDVDYCVALHQLGPLLVQLTNTPIRDGAREVQDNVRIETEFAMMKRDIHDMGRLGNLSAFTCPSCRGALWEIEEGGRLRYRCHTGHAFSQESLLAGQSESAEEALYAALRALEEKAASLRRLAERFDGKNPTTATRFQNEANTIDVDADVLRGLLAKGRA